MFSADRWKELADKYTDTNSAESLAELRGYLDSVGMIMPLPKYQYRPEQRSTWRFLDGRVHVDENKSIRKYVNVYNIHFKNEKRI